MSEKNDTVTDITHLKAVIMAVFRAEDSIPEHFKERLRTKTDDPEEMRKIADEYVTAIAEELMKHQIG